MGGGEVRPGSWSSGRSWRRRAEAEVSPCDREARSCGRGTGAAEEGRPESRYESRRRRRAEPEELSCARAALWLEAAVGPSDWPAREEGAGHGCGSGCCCCVSCAESCASGAARGRLRGTARSSWGGTGAEEAARAFLPTEICWMTMTKRTRDGLTLGPAWAGGASLCCASVKPSDWPAGVGAGRWLGG